MTAREVFEFALIELNKVEAPSLLLEDYNYFINKAIYQYINKAYNMYDLNQQKTDDLRVLKATALLDVGEFQQSPNWGDKVYVVNLPSDYFHMLNCIVNYGVKKSFKCYNTQDTIQFGAKRLTSDMYGQIINNYYMRPMYKRPYYFVINDLKKQPDHIDTISGLVTGYLGDAKFTGSLTGTVSQNQTYQFTGLVSGKFADTKITGSQTFTITGAVIGSVKGNITGEVTATVENGVVTSAVVTGVVSEIADAVKLELRYGKSNDIFEAKQILVDYLKTPTRIRLTQDEVDMDEDKSQILEFPDYVCQEIINELVKLLMENAMDPRLQSNIPINQTIAPPAQAQPQEGGRR